MNLLETEIIKICMKFDLDNSKYVLDYLNKKNEEQQMIIYEFMRMLEIENSGFTFTQKGVIK